MEDIRIKHLLEKLYIEYEEDDDTKFSEDFMESDFIWYEIDNFFEYYAPHLAYKLPKLFTHLSFYSYDRSINEILNDQEFEGDFQKSIHYGFLALDYSARLCKCMEGNTYVDMLRVSLFLGLNYLYGSFKNTKTLLTHLANSLNGKNCVIARGDNDAVRSWFVIDLLTKIIEIDIDRRRALYPRRKDYGLLGEVIDIWDSEDLTLVNKYVSLLCDLHLTHYLIDLDEMDREDALPYMLEFEMPCFQIFPYEVLVLLKVRKEKGLENPKEYSHPLMNTKIIKALSILKTPLEFIDDLPFHQKIIKLIQDECPDFRGYDAN
jgi:hypothetical protein